MASYLKIVLATCFLFAATAAGQIVDEYQVKAGFVSGFASFVEWPPETFKGAHQPIGICVLGRNPFGNFLKSMTVGKVVEARTLTVRQIVEVREAEGCQILFVSSSEHLRFRKILGSLRSQGIFTVGDTSDFIAEGGIVNLRLDNGRVRIEINEDAAQDRHLRISSHLLQLVKNVKR
jgi:hypothetical protein